MKKQALIVTGVVIVVVIALAAVIYSRRDEMGDGSVKIGAVLPMTGDLSFIGEEIQRGMEIARGEAAKKGFETEVIYEDDQSFNLREATNAARKLINIDGVDVGVTAFMEQSQPIAPIFSSAQTPLVVLWDSNESIMESGEHVFSTGFSTEAAGRNMAAYSYEELGIRTVAVVAHIDPWSELISKSFQEKFEDLGGRVVLKQNHQVENADFRTSLTRVKQVGPDAVYFPLIPPAVADFIIQAKQAGLETIMLSADGLVQDAIDAAGGAAEGIYMTNISTDTADELTAKYIAAFGSDPLDITMVSFGYDGFNTIKEAVEKSGSNNIYGGLLQILGNDRSINRIQKLYQVENGVPGLVR